MNSKVALLETLSEQIQSRAMQSIARLADVTRGDSILSDQLRSKFEEAIADISSVEFAELGPKCGSFFVSKRKLRIANRPVADLLFSVIDSFHEQSGQPSLDLDELFELFDRVLAGYIFHELRHRTQGVEVYTSVSDIRLTGGTMVMAQLDAMADCDAAIAGAAIRQPEDRDTFLTYFQEALYLSATFYFRVFPPTVDRPDKIARAMGVLLMLARLELALTEQGFSEDSRFPLDTPMFAYLKSDARLLTVWRGEPGPFLLGACNDTEAIDGLVEDIVAGRFDRAIARCMAILRSFKMQ